MKISTVPCSLFLAPCSLFLAPCSLFLVPCSLFLAPCSLLPVPCSLFLVPCSLFPVPCSLFLVPCSLFLVPCSLFLVPCSLLFPIAFVNNRIICKIILLRQWGQFGHPFFGGLIILGHNWFAHRIIALAVASGPLEKVILAF